MKIIIDRLAFGGYGVGTINGKIIFVNYALPGDELEIEIFQDYKSYSFADYNNIINPSPFRITSPCPNFAECGGCTYLNLSYSNEIKYKKFLVNEQLKKAGSIFQEQEMKIITADRFHYRSHASIKSGKKDTGFFSRNSNSIIPFPNEGCLLLSEILNHGIKQNKFTRHEGEIKISEDKDNNFLFYSTDENICIIEEQVGEFIYQRKISGFFQSNKFLRKQMIDIVCHYSNLTENDEFIDICSGCGFFTIPLSKFSLKGAGFDIDKNSIASAVKNASLNNCTNISFYNISESGINPARFNPKTVIVDPPRSGITKKGRKTINAMNPEIIVYVSCNPSTFSRDIMDFFKNNYRLAEITLIDMFPCTHHIELISKIVKVGLQ